MLFCVPDLDGGALPFFLQLHPLVDNERAVVTFSRIPSFLGQATVTFVGSDEGVLFFHNSLHSDGVILHMWNPVTEQAVDVCPPAGLTYGMIMRCGFAFNQKNREFCITVIWDSVDGDARTFMYVFCSFTRTWCDAPQPVYSAMGIFNESIHIDGYIYWLSAEKDTVYGDSHVIIGWNVQDRAWKMIKVPFSVSESHWDFITVDNRLGNATWTNMTEYHKTRLFIVIPEKIQFYDDEEHNISQGLIFLESQDIGIIRRRKKTETKKVINIESSFEYSTPLNRDVFKRNKNSNVIGKDEDISHNSPLSESQPSTHGCSRHGGRSIEARLCSIERIGNLSKRNPNLMIDN
ncbi:F-box/kelch-repeat protein [Senna tora]|uniref:F-box/kelch-repeat protein n=1 Tax=Senna tora TaxID=362788 RepID=A0A834WPJ2_9FABA|nr:F-box/kelch-repeat protein [Senna tora]